MVVISSISGCGRGSIKEPCSTINGAPMREGAHKGKRRDNGTVGVMENTQRALHDAPNTTISRNIMGTGRV